MNALAQNPQAMFGVLVALECGMSPKHLAARLGQAEATLITAAEAARAGDMPRQPAWEGERMASEALRLGPMPAWREEVLVHRWMRRVCRQLAERGAIPVAEFRAIVDTESTGVAAWLKQLTTQFKPLGISLKTKPYGDGGATFVLDPESRGRLKALIASDWRVAA